MIDNELEWHSPTHFYTRCNSVQYNACMLWCFYCLSDGNDIFSINSLQCMHYFLKEIDEQTEISIFEYFSFCSFSTFHTAISWRSFLLAEETGMLRVSHQHAASNWQTVSYNVASSTPRLNESELTTLVVIGTHCTYNCKSNWNAIMTTTSRWIIDFVSCTMHKLDILFRTECNREQNSLIFWPFLRSENPNFQNLNMFISKLIDGHNK